MITTDDIYDQSTYQTKQLLVPTIDYECNEGFFKVVEFKSKVMKDYRWLKSIFLAGTYIKFRNTFKVLLVKRQEVLES